LYIASLSVFIQKALYSQFKMPPRKRKADIDSTDETQRSKRREEMQFCECIYYCRGGKFVSISTYNRHIGIDAKMASQNKKPPQRDEEVICKFCSEFPNGHAVSISTWYAHKKAIDRLENRALGAAVELTRRHREFSGEADILANCDSNNQPGNSALLDDLDDFDNLDEDDNNDQQEMSRASRQAAADAQEAQEAAERAQKEQDEEAKRRMYELRDEELDFLENYTYFDTAFGDYPPPEEQGSAASSTATYGDVVLQGQRKFAAEFSSHVI
jgi:hypothetical protein